ncbi:MAG: hypothetical protein JO316_07220 [Abitibacteriaceae bacterium]|nr:hypothetical protein [Abditibacteriaceae bacterium]
MTGSVHVAIGAALGKYIKIKPLAYAVGVLSHLMGDITPHKDVGPMEAPIVFGTLALVGFKHGWTSSQFLGALGGITPDFEHIPAELRKDPRRHGPMEEKLFPTHNGQLEHAHWPLHPALGVAMQIVLYFGCLYLAGTFRKSET